MWSLLAGHHIGALGREKSRTFFYWYTGGGGRLRRLISPLGADREEKGQYGSGWAGLIRHDSRLAGRRILRASGCVGLSSFFRIQLEAAGPTRLKRGRRSRTEANAGGDGDREHGLRSGSGHGVEQDQRDAGS